MGLQRRHKQEVLERHELGMEGCIGFSHLLHLWRRFGQHAESGGLIYAPTVRYRHVAHRSLIHPPVPQMTLVPITPMLTVALPVIISLTTRLSLWLGPV